MKTPEERYNNDPIYRRMVDIMEANITACNVSPSELREMVILACIHHELRKPLRSTWPVTDEILKAFGTLDQWRKNERHKNS